MKNTGRTHFKKGHIPWNKGKRCHKLKGENSYLWKGGITHPKCEDCGKSIRWRSARCYVCRGKFLRGNKHHNWKGGISVNVHSPREPRYKEWRNSVFTRDNYTCQECNQKGGYLEAHHIKSWAKYPELRYEIKNGLTLCKPCHKLTPNYRGKKYG